MKKNIIVLALAAASLSLLWLFPKPARQGMEKNKPAAGAGVKTDAAMPAAGGMAAPEPVLQEAPAVAKPAAERPVQTTPVLPADLQVAAVTSAVAELRKIYGYAGSLSYDEARDLTQRRKKAAAELAEKLAQLGPGGARIMAEQFLAGLPTREKLLLIDGLKGINDPASPEVLAELLNEENSFSVQKELIAALGLRPEDSCVNLLSEILSSQTNAQLRFAAAQSLSGREAALPVLTDLVASDPSPAIQVESVRAIGLIGNDQAREALGDIARGNPSVDVRVSAIRELGRSFSGEALPDLSSLLQNSDEAIRLAVVTAVSSIHTPEAVALLESVMAGDPSEAVRAKATASLGVARLSAQTGAN